ncbi:PHD finger protein 21A-like [Crassostrea virginica]|uniref:PHD finger protein 21A-like n=1 Tax=Crassostrea virginica TaxID=6565 RepID=A0A8B8C4T6_CRAVI|nr:PHD finger protein 21A-like [Crassostrea virginica]
MVSQSDLDEIQAQLKISIQNHQALVTSMKDEPQNAELKRKLHELQKEILILSEKQKGIVQRLRTDIVNRKPNQHAPKKSPAKSQEPTPQPAHIMPRPIQPRPIQPAPPMQPVVLRQPVQPIQPKPVNENAPPTQNSGVGAPQKPGSPPIRVPTYHRPSILQGSKSPISKSHHTTSSFVRKLSDADNRELTKQPEKKQVSLEEKEKMAFIAALDLVTQETLKELQNRRYERKRRTTANPLYNFEPERKRPQSLMLTSSTSNPPNGKRGRGRPPKTRSPNNSIPSTPESTENHNINGMSRPNNDAHDDFCGVCNQSGQLLLCDTCSKVYHLQCLDPPLSEIPDGRWCCPKCQASGKGGWSSDAIARVNNFITSKSAKEEEKRRLQRRNSDLISEKSQLENKNKQMNDSLTVQMQRRESLVEKSKLHQQKIESLKNFIKLLQNS